ETYKLSLLPSGVVRPGKLSVLGNGVVIDPWALAEEIERLTTRGVAVTPTSLRIADNATLILPLHRELDVLREAAAGEGRIGTTGRGIGPAYEDKVGRRAIRLQDLKNLGTLGPKVDRILVHHNALRRGLGQPEIAKDELMRELTEIAPKILPYMDVTWELLDARRKAGDRILFEGAQGALLDVEHGGGPGGDRVRHGAGVHQLCSRHCQGVHDSRWSRPVPDRASRRDRRRDRPARQGVRHRYGPQAALRLVRCLPRPSGHEGVR